jgi:hypothetical protein
VTSDDALVARSSRNCHRAAGLLQHGAAKVTDMAPTTLLPPALIPPTATTRETQDGAVLDLTVVGVLDERTGTALLSAVDDAAAAGWQRIEVDLREVTAHTDQGAAAISRLCRAGSRLPLGIGFSVEAGPSREALLDALAHA